MEKTSEFIIACKNNQARSIVATAALRSVFPEFVFKSFGVDVNDKRPIPQSILAILNDWGLLKYDRFSSNLEDLNLLGTDYHFLAADNYVFECLKETVENLSSIEDVILSQSLLPKDPAGLDYIEYPAELSKFILAAITWFERQSKLQMRNIEALFFTSNKSLYDYDFQRFNNPEFVIIDTNVVYPNSTVYDFEGFEVLYFNPRELVSPKKFSEKNGNLLIAKYEFSNSARLMLSKSWRSFLEEVTQTKKVLLITYPYNKESSKLALEFLGLCHATSLTVVN